MKFNAVIVLYNKNIWNSQSVVSLKKMNSMDIKIIVLDNSSEAFIAKNNEWANQNSLQYFSMGGNVGLSKAYNYALNILKNSDSDDIVIWFDDDTPVKIEYFEVLREYANKKEIDVFAPVILGQNGVIYSPNEIGLFRGKYIKSSSQPISSKKFNAINSCLAVRLRVYKEYSYDETLFMDCVDTKLFDDLRNMNLNFCVLPVEIHQNFFQRSNQSDVENYWKRFQIRIRDTVVYSSRSFKTKVIGLIRIYGWAVVYGIKLKSPKFCINCLKLGTSLMLDRRRWIYESKKN